MQRTTILVFTFGTAILLAGCSVDEFIPEPSAANILQGGDATIFSSGPDAYTFPVPGLNAAELDKHFLADGAFEQQYVSAPADQFGGLGPLFNQNSCVSCHVRNGRGNAPQFTGDPYSGLLLRISVPGAGAHGAILPVPGFGGQFQNKSIIGTDAEGIMHREDMLEVIAYLDGMQTTLVRPHYSIADPYTTIPGTVLISPRIAPPVFGLGLLEAVPDAHILANADPYDSNGDGISGKINVVWDPASASLRNGKFGWKCESPTALHQAAAAAHDDMGLTSPMFPEEHCAGQDNCTDGLQTETDVDDETIDLFAFYFQSLAVPARRNSDNEQVQRGEALFYEIKCDACHVSSLQTSVYAIAALSDQTIYPYTDLLLHDMGEGLSDNRPTFLASGSEWRTAPLWGIGLTQVVNPKAGFLHDGRASTLEEAILWHGGEGEISKEKFRGLPKSDRDALVAFLRSL